MRLNLADKVAIVTGAGGGLGRQHALLLARLGARVVVNDRGGSLAGTGQSATPAQTVAEEIIASGGQALANTASVTDFDQVGSMVASTVDRWGRVDILVNNAGILRDKTFAKLEIPDFREVVDVHLMGSVHCTKAVWERMRSQKFGRVVFTTSSSGLFGNFGQSSYCAAKLALVGLMKTLSQEGSNHNIRVNCIAPTAATRMLEGLLPPEELNTLDAGAVSPAIAALVAEDAPSGIVLCAGGGSFESSHITLTRGVFLGRGDHVAQELLDQLEDVAARGGETVPATGFDQAALELRKAKAAVRS